MTHKSEKDANKPSSMAFWAAIVVLILCCVAAVEWAQGPLPTEGQMGRRLQNIFNVFGHNAQIILELSWLVLAITGIICVIVVGILLWILFRYRAKNNKDTEPSQIYGSDALEVSWTVLPIILVIVLGLASVRTLWTLNTPTAPEQALNIKVVGHQWWWEFEYPEYGFKTANELHIPISAKDKRNISFLTMSSADVVHAFWVPQLAGKIDVVPGRTTTLELEPSATGLFLGRCAEYCGTQHGNMMIRVVVHEEKEFDKWVKNQQSLSVNLPTVAKGRQIFEKTSCINCHTLRGTIATGTFGPDLTHLMSRETLAAGMVPNNPENLNQWIKDPDSIKPGCLMPDMKLSDKEHKLLVSYLLTLR